MKPSSRQQCKDIPDRPILELLAQNPDEWHTWYEAIPGGMPTVRTAMPPNTPDRLILAKMNKLLRRGLVDGCGCGCRGDFEITDKGLAFLVAAAKAFHPVTGISVTPDPQQGAPAPSKRHSSL